MRYFAQRSEIALKNDYETRVTLTEQAVVTRLAKLDRLASSPAAGTLAAGLNKFVLTYIAAAPPVHRTRQSVVAAIPPGNDVDPGRAQRHT